MEDFTKLYVAYKIGLRGNNILDVYFSFIANIIIENKLTYIEDVQIQKLFNDRYNFGFPLTVVRQVLSVGVQNGCFVYDCGKYSVVTENLRSHCFSGSDFEEKWNNLTDSFCDYSKKFNIIFTRDEAEKFILDIIDNDDVILFKDFLQEKEGIEEKEYVWYKFVEDCVDTQSELFEYIASLCASNVEGQALFYCETSSQEFAGLNVYLDTPMVFALLGMDTQTRSDSYRMLLSDMIDSGCSVQVLDHNFQEVDGIISRAARWARSSDYDIRKANNATRFFHDSDMSQQDIDEFSENIEEKLNSIGISVRETHYDVYQNKFQEDENKLYNMILEKYATRGLAPDLEREKSIRIDVRSIVIVYREREGHSATKINQARHILLTSNNVVANVSKNYESNQSNDAGHIPACISADLFGTILWLSTPHQMLSYLKKKLLADCYDFLRPNKILLDHYIKSIETARREDEIDERKFLLLRTHPVVLDTLMDVTHGDYARFNSNTYKEVYNEIVQESRKDYFDEVASHQETKRELVKQKNQNKELADENESLKNKIKLQVVQEFSRKLKTRGWLLTIVALVIPYIALEAIIQIIMYQFFEVIFFSTSSLLSIFILCFLYLLILIIARLYQLGKDFCFSFIAKRIIQSDSKYQGIQYEDLINQKKGRKSKS